jgi:hypothetical protein
MYTMLKVTISYPTWQLIFPYRPRDKVINQRRTYLPSSSLRLTKFFPRSGVECPVMCVFMNDSSHDIIIEEDPQNDCTIRWSGSNPLTRHLVTEVHHCRTDLIVHFYPQWQRVEWRKVAQSKVCIALFRVKIKVAFSKSTYCT